MPPGRGYTSWAAADCKIFIVGNESSLPPQQLIVDVARDQSIRGAVEAVRVEQQLEDEILRAAGAARGNPRELQKLDGYVKRDKRALGLITSLLGGNVSTRVQSPTIDQKN